VRARDQLRTPSKGGAKMRTLFAGLLRCSSCGGPMTAIDARRYGCHAWRDRGASVCAGNGGAFPRSDVDQALLSVVREDLLAPDVLAAVQASARAAARGRGRRRSHRPMPRRRARTRYGARSRAWWTRWHRWA
jgi:hypothetical protein